METSSTVWLLDNNNWLHQHKEIHSKYVDFSIVACDIFSIIPHSVGVQASVSLGRDIVGWRQSETTGEMLWDKVIGWQFD